MTPVPVAAPQPAPFHFKHEVKVPPDHFTMQVISGLDHFNR
jgi:hypothetical protein